MVQDLYIGQGVTVGLNKNKILEGFGHRDFWKTRLEWTNYPLAEELEQKVKLIFHR
jgi:hypothetical protein